MSEWVYRLGKGVGPVPWQHEHVGFGMDQAARSPRFQLKSGLLRRKMRWSSVFMVFSEV